jgi:lipopolysaccharide export system protein LptC
MSTRGIELELPDLPEVPISLGPVAGGPAAPQQSAAVRLWDALMSWLPLILMGCLALGSWWLVKNAPQPAGTGPMAAPRTAADYTMSGLTLQRFGTDGQLKLQIEGAVLRHLPQAQQVEIDDARILALAPGGRVTRARATQVVATDDGTLVELKGQAEVRSVTASGQPAQMSSESFKFFPAEQRLSGDQPVELQVGAHRLTAGGIEADQRTDIVTLQPPLKGVFPP